MQEEISLREIIETIWDGKWVIVIITAAAVILTGLTTKFVLPSIYEATSTVRVGDGSGEGIVQKLNSFAESTKTDVSLKRVIDNLSLDNQEYTIQSIRKDTKVEVVRDTGLIKLTVQGENPETITNISNLLAFELGARIEITDRAQEIVNHQKRLNNIDNNISIISKDLEEAEKLLAETPEYLVTRQSLANEPFLHSVIAESTNESNRELGALQLESQTINPVYTSLQNQIKDDILELTRLTQEKENLEKELTFNNTRIQELEQQIDRGKLNASNSQRLLNGFNAVFVSPAITPTEPVRPKLILNLAIGFTVGLMISMLIVFIRHYWRTTNPIHSTKNDNGLSI